VKADANADLSIGYIQVVIKRSSGAIADV